LYASITTNTPTSSPRPQTVSASGKKRDYKPTDTSSLLPHDGAKQDEACACHRRSNQENWSLSASNFETPHFEVTRNLAALEGRSSTQVSLKARVIIAGQMQSYGDRTIQMELVLKSPLGNTYYDESALGWNK
jgi:hypothetical protein